MAANLGNSALKRRQRRGLPMREFDRLPPELRSWLGSAVLPWHPNSVHRVYKRTLAKTTDTAQAIKHLSEIERKLIAKDARRIWGSEHPYLSARPDA